VKVHPRLEQSGHGLECYDTVAIQFDGHDNETIRQRLEAVCRRLGYTVVSESKDLQLNVFVRDSKERNLVGQMAMMYWFCWNFCVGDAYICAEAKLLEVSSGDTLLQFGAKRTGMTNYDATSSWADALKSVWQRYIGDRRNPASSETRFVVRGSLHQRAHTPIPVSDER
jgi:hypothetical protein